MFKNVASQKWTVFAFDETDNTPKTGDAANITCKVKKDGAAAAALTDVNPTEVEDGFYDFDVTQAESNGDKLLMLPESSTANIQVIGCPAVIYTRPANFTSMGIESDGDLTKVNEVHGHTAQTGDNFAIVNGDHGCVSIQDDVDTLLTRITAAVALASVCTEARLSELDAATAGKAANQIDEIRTDTEDIQTQVGTAGAGLTAVPWNNGWDAEVQSECTDALNAYDPPTKTELDSAFTEIKGATWAAGTDTLEHIRDKQTDIETDTQDIQTQVGTAGAGLTDLGGMSTTMKGEVNAEVDTALNTAIPATPTGDSVNDYIQRIKYVTVNKMEVTEADGTTIIYKDNDSTQYCNVASAFSTDSTTTTRKRLE